MPPDLRSTVEKNESIINFLKSAEFSQLIEQIVSKETNKLQQEIITLRNEVNILKESNIELIHLLANNTGKSNSLKDQHKTKEISPISYSDTLKKSSKNNEKPASGVQKQKPNIKTTTKDNESPENKIPINDNGWSKITKKKRDNGRLEVIRGTGQSSSEIKGAVQFSHFHVFRLEPNITANSLINYLNSKNINEVTCEKLNSKHPAEYSSYKVSVPTKYAEEIMKPETWPENVCINRFLQRLVNLNLAK